jgi:hypothetical protein
MNKENWIRNITKSGFIFLLPLFFVLHGNNENFNLIPLTVLLSLFLKYFFISGLVLVLSLLFLKLSKAIIFTICILLLFFFFGAFHDFLKSLTGNTLFTSYTFILPALFLLFLLLFFWIKKTGLDFAKPMKYFRYLFFIFLLLEGVTFFYYVLTQQSVNDLSDNKRSLNTLPEGCTETTKPDIFFLVLDGYTSSACLQKQFNYSNSSLDSLLTANHFFTSYASSSNYNITPFSLSSTFDAQYLDAGLEKQVIVRRSILQAIKTFKNNGLVTFLKDQGYEIKNYGCFDLEGYPSQRETYFADSYSQQIDNQTFFFRIKRDIGWNFTIKNLVTGAFRIPERYKKSKQYHLERNEFNLNGLIKEIQTSSPAPRFVYAHLMLPHEPFYLKSDGSFTSDTAILKNLIDPRVGYINQVGYTNTLLERLIPLVPKGSDRERVMIIEGDHGFRDYGDTVDKNYEFMNLNSYFFSDNDYRLLYNGISPVNSFRVIRNKYFCGSFPLLKDSSIHLINDK